MPTSNKNDEAKNLEAAMKRIEDGFQKISAALSAGVLKMFCRNDQG